MILLALSSGTEPPVVTHPHRHNTSTAAEVGTDMEVEPNVFQ